MRKTNTNEVMGNEADDSRVPAGRVAGSPAGPVDNHGPASRPEASSLRFASAARSLGRAARLRGLVVPVFRSPPRIAGVQRSIRRRPDAPSVAVQLRRRPWAAVLADMVEGVVVANDLTGAPADRIRAAMWLAVGDIEDLAPQETVHAPTSSAVAA